MIARLATAALLALTGAAKLSTPPVITVIATDFAFEIPGGENATAPAGPVTLRLVNHGKELHMMAVIWLGDKTVSDFMNKVTHDAVEGMGVGGVNAIAPGDTGTATVILEPGNAVIACWVSSADGKAHVLKGMFAPLRVEPNAGQPAAEPHATSDIALHDYAITVPNGLRAGRHVFRVDNDGSITHDLELFRVSPGGDTTDVMAWVDNPAVGSPRITPLGGIVGEQHGLHSYFSATLTPGDYMFLCWIPDAKTGVPHFYGHHMWTTVHVSP